MNMKKYDPLLPGKHFKSIRNAKNKFYNEHKISIENTINVPEESLYKIVNGWRSKREHGDHAYYYRYQLMIKRGFWGMKTARVLIADGIPVGFNAGWEISNRPKEFYAAVGIHDYSLRDLGLILYLEDLEWIKNNGYKAANMGGIEEGGGLDFKNQFLPESSYKTYTFSIVKR